MPRMLMVLMVVCLPVAAWGQLKSQSTQVHNSTASSDTSSIDERPCLVSDGAGNWVSVWDSQFNLGGTIGADFDVLLSRSSDDGATWSSPAALNSTAVSDGSSRDQSANLATDGNGVWLAAWQSNNTLGDTIGTDDDILYSRSTNNGATWSTVAVLNSTATTDTAPDTLVTVAWVSGSNWVATWQSENDFGGTAGTDADIVYAYSTDDGATWSAAALLNSTATIDGTSTDQYPRVAGDGAGNAITVWTSSYNLGGTIGTDNDILYATSADNGQTWSAAAALNSSAATDSGDSDFDAVLATDKDGVWVASWRSQWGPTGGDNEILASRSTNNGSTWSAMQVVNGSGPTDSGANDLEQRIAASGPDVFAVTWVSALTTDGSNDQDILVSVTNNGGASWSGVTYLHDTAYSDGTSSDDHCQVGGNGSGSFVGLWRSVYNLGGTIGTDTDIFRANFTPDFTAPDAVTITPASTGPTAADSMAFTVTFNQDVTGFSAAADVVITHSGTAHSGITFSGGPAIYTVTVNNIFGDGTFTLATATGTGIVNNLGVGVGSSVTSAAVTIDNTPVNATAITAVTPSPSNADSVEFSVTFDDNVTGFNDAADLLVTHSGTASTGVAINGGPSLYTVFVDGVTGDGSFTLAVNGAAGILDDVGLGLASSVTSAVFSVDNTAPGITLTATAGNPVGGAFTVDVLTGESTTDFDLGDLSLTNATANSFTGSGDTYSFTLVPTATPCSVSVNAGAFTDVAGNGNTVSNVVSRNFDGTLPSATSIVPSETGPTNATSIDFAVTFDESVQNFNDAADVALTHTGTSSTGVTISGGPTTYTVSVTGISGDGSFTLEASTASDVQDLVNNPLNASVTSAAVLIDNTAPSFTGLVATPSEAVAGDTVAIAFESSEDLAGAPDVTVNGNPASAAKTAYGYEYLVLEADPIGPATIVISGIDDAGNTGSLTDNSALDIVAPMPIAAWPLVCGLALAGGALLRWRRRKQ